MKLIRPCPNCKIELRFPIDKGTVRITCPNCKHEFLANPDNPALYKESKFDLFSKSKLTDSKKVLTFLFYLVLALSLFFLFFDFKKIITLIQNPLENNLPETSTEEKNEI